MAKNKKGDKIKEVPSVGVTQPHPMDAAMAQNMGMPGTQMGGAPNTKIDSTDRLKQTTSLNKQNKAKQNKKDAKKKETQTRDQLAEFKKKNAGVDLSQLTPEQLSQLQLEEAIKESSNPSANLIKLRNPLGIKGCLLNFLFFVILTLGLAVLICYIQIDSFNLGVVLKDILQKFGIWQFFTKVFKTIGGWFTSGSGSGSVITALRMLLG